MSLSLADAARIGGSDLAALLGMSPFKDATPLAVYARIVAAQEGRSVERDDGALRRGRHLERAVLSLYAEEMGVEVLPAMQLRASAPWLRASLDGRVRRPGLRVVDAKTGGRQAVRHWGEPGTDQVPQYIIFQMAFYVGEGLASGELEEPVADVAALVAGDLAVYHVPHDPEFYGLLLSAAERFWKDHVLPRRPPPVTQPEDVAAITTLYHRHKGEARDWSELATEEQRAVREWMEAKRALDAAKRLEAQCGAHVRLLLKETPSLTGLPQDTGIRHVDWRQNRASQATDWQAVAGELSDLNDSVVRSIIAKHTIMKEGARPLKTYALREEE